MYSGRLFEIVYLLLEKGTISARLLSERLEVSVRTIYRDIDTLSRAGIPVYMSSGRNGGISLMPDFVLNKAILSQKEKEDILSALQGLYAAQNSGQKEALSKLGAFFGSSNQSWVEVEFSGWGWSREAKESFALLKNAIIGKKVVSFSYFGGSGLGEDRIAEPLRLVFRGQAWYLYAYCRKRTGMRYFKLTRIENLTVLDESFTRIAPESATTYSAPKLQTELIEFISDAEISPRIYDEFPHRSISVNEDDRLHVNVELPVGDWLADYLLSYGEHIEVIKPNWLREEISAKIIMLKEKYKI